MKILITGVAGFIGMHTAQSFLINKHEVVGIDNLNDYYDISLKKARLKQLKLFNKSFKFFKVDLVNSNKLAKIFKENNFDIVVNLAAQAGVRYSISNPDIYLKSNLDGFFNILECCRKNQISHLIYASSSSVYGSSDEVKFCENNDTSHPLSFYGATKKANEVMAHSYSHVYGLRVTGLRFFTVYGPWGRPDMALFLFTKSILSDIPIKVYNKGQMIRDFTYIDDVVKAIRGITLKVDDEINNINYNNNEIMRSPKYKLFNIGNGKPINLLDYINLLEEVLEKKANKVFLPLPAADIIRTSSDNKLLEDFIDFKPNTSIRKGVINFVKWYKDFYNL